MNDMTTKESGDFLAMLERIATNNEVDANKLEKLLDVQERILDKRAEQEFWTDFARMKKRLPYISRGGAILNRAKEVQSRYSRYDEDIHPTIVPILSKYGFSLMHRQTGTETGSVIVKTVLTHKGGYQMSSSFSLDADSSGNKNPTQAAGSARSYAKRYNVIDLLDLACEGQDDDGNGASQPGKDRITDDQVAEMEAKIKQVGADKGAFLKYAKVNNLSDIHPNAYKSLFNKLEAKAKGRYQ